MMAANPSFNIPFMSPECMMKMFTDYKASCRIRLESCGDNSVLKIKSLESMVNELIEQNELLLNSLVELQSSKSDSLVMSSTSFSSGYSASSSSCSSAARAYEQNHQSGAKHVSVVDVGIQVADQIEADKINELNTITEQLRKENETMKQELDEMSDKNEDLKHDLINLLSIFKATNGDKKDAKNLIENVSTSKHLTFFCDSISPEDIYGPIESIREEDEAAIIPERADVNNLSSDESSCTSSPSHKLAGAIKSQTNLKSKSKSSSTSSLLLLMEEKEHLIENLQKHLESVTKQIIISDEVIKKVEEKLKHKRKECQDWMNKYTEIEAKLNESTKKYCELKTRELSLIESKRDLMIKLQNESDTSIEMKENYSILKKQLAQVVKQNQYQTMTIEHLKEALVISKRGSDPNVNMDPVKNCTTNKSSPHLSSSTGAHNYNQQRNIYKLDHV